MPEAPSPMASNGRRPDGTFAPGHKFARGNPLARKAQQLRSALMRAVSAGDLRAVVKMLVDQAKAGDIGAAKLLLDRALGPPVEIDLVARLEALEQAAEEL